jgi:hypothetical protein
MAIADKLTKLQTDITSAYTTISSKGGTIPSDKNTDNLSTAINSIPSGGPTPEAVEKDVNFYDYDGTRLYSYTQSEFAQLQSLPANPSHEGLTAQGWNWTLSDAQTYVAEYKELEIGQQYKTDDNTIRYYVRYDDDIYKEMSFKILSTEDTTINWGDNTTSTIEANIETTSTHTYSSIGDYKIVISTEGTLTMGTGFLPNNRDKSKVIKVELPDTVEYADVTQLIYDYDSMETINIPYKSTPIINSNKTYMFAYARSLKYIVVPSGTPNLPNNFLDTADQLKGISLPKSYDVSTRNQIFSHCTQLTRITLPEMNGLGQSVSSFEYCSKLNRLTIPSEVKTINSNAFANLRYCYLFDFTHHESVPTLRSTNAFGNIYVNYSIVVPDSLYNTWIATSPWNNSTIVDHIIKKSSYYGS